jgi:EAL and modified HD-GYP domain-containing signal transduction protein
MQDQLAIDSTFATPEGAGEVRYFARQPILNRDGRVHAYELLFRNGPGAASRGDGSMATGTMIDNAVIFGLEQLTTGLPAFINCTSEAITEKLVTVLPPERTVLGIPATLEINSSIVGACRELNREGFRFLLDDFIWSATLDPLLDLADYVRVDYTRLDDLDSRCLQRGSGKSTSIVVKKVDTQENYQKASAAGCTFFQGDYFCHPDLLKKNKIPANRLSHFDIVRQLHNDPIDIRQISRLVMRDPALTYRLLRLVNSPLYATHREVCSIESAIMIIGDLALRRIVSLAILSEINADQPPEILHMALVRGRFCELAARFCWLNPPEQYLLGMFSMVSAMLRVPIKDVKSLLPLRNQICRALEGEKNHERALLTWLEFHEHADWESCDTIGNSIGLSHDKLMLCYVDAVVWAQITLSAVI